MTNELKEPTAQRQPMAVYILNFLPIFFHIMRVAPDLVTICSLSQRTDVRNSFKSKCREILVNGAKTKSCVFVSTELQKTKASD